MDPNYPKILNRLKSEVELNDISDVMTFIENKFDNVHTKKKYLVAYKMYIDNELNIKILEYAKEEKTFYEKSEFTPQQKKNVITWDQVEETLNNIEQKIDENRQSLFKIKDLLFQWCLLSLYVLLPPRRCKDYMNFYFNKDETNGLVFDKDKVTMVIKDYKTKNTYGLYQKEIKNEKQIKYFKEYINLNGINEGDALWSFTPSRFTKIISTIFTDHLEDSPSNVTVNILRHIYISEKGLLSIEKRKELACEMGHSYNENIEYIKVPSDQQ